MADPVTPAGDTPADGTPAGDAQEGARVEPVVVTPSPDAVEVLPAPHDAEDAFVAAAAAHEERFSLLLNREPAHRRTFLVAAVALGAIAAAALVGLAVSLSTTPSKDKPFVQGIAPGTTAGAISAADGGWHPVCDISFGCDKPHQIAAYVAPKYQLTKGKSIVTITAGPPTLANSDGTAMDVPVIVERNDRGARVAYTGQSQDNTVEYKMCGFGTACQIGGTPSVARGYLLRREALELALLTFKYDTSVKSVVTFFPKPAKTTDAPYALFFKRADYEQQLARPLADTLGKQVVVLPTTLLPADTKRIGDITSPRVFTFTYKQDQQGFWILWLTPATY